MVQRRGQQYAHKREPRAVGKCDFEEENIEEERREERGKDTLREQDLKEIKDGIELYKKRTWKCK